MDQNLLEVILQKLDRLEDKLDTYQARLVTLENQQGFIRKGFNLVLGIITSTLTYIIYRYLDPR